MTRQPTLIERALAEALGTFMLVFIGGGAGAMATIAQAHNQSTGLANLLLIALAHGFALFAIIQIVGKVSGAHVNPAVTLGLAAIGRFPVSEVLAYILGQVVGAIAGAAAILVVYGTDAAKIGHLGAPALATGVGTLQGMFIEALGAAILVLAIMGSAVDNRSVAGWAGLSIGIALAAVILFLGPATGASVNPFRALGPDVVAGLFFGVNIDWLAYLVSYLVGPIVGAVVAAYAYAYIAHLPRPRR